MTNKEIKMVGTLREDGKIQIEFDTSLFTDLNSSSNDEIIKQDTTKDKDGVVIHYQIKLDAKYKRKYLEAFRVIEIDGFKFKELVVDIKKIDDIANVNYRKGDIIYNPRTDNKYKTKDSKGTFGRVIGYYYGSSGEKKYDSLKFRVIPINTKEEIEQSSWNYTTLLKHIPQGFKCDKVK